MSGMSDSLPDEERVEDLSPRELRRLIRGVVQLANMADRALSAIVNPLVGRVQCAIRPRHGK